VWPGSDELDLDANLEFHAERLRPVAETWDSRHGGWCREEVEQELG
jgi:hypothetical protein